MTTSYEAMTGIDVLTSSVAVPGMGLIPVNAFVLHGPEPVLVDTGPVTECDDFLAALGTVIDPADLRWIWLTHTDFDHIGALHRLLEVNPQLRVITSFVGVGIMGLFAPLPMDRVFLINPGQSVTVGDRTLTAMRPPTFDNPITTGFVDSATGVLVSSDSFGALLQRVPESAAELTHDELRDGQVFWATVDSPWIHKVDEHALATELDAIRALAPTMILSSHLPAAPGDMTERMLASVAAAPSASPFVGPDQAALEAMLAEMSAGG